MIINVSDADVKLNKLTKNTTALRFALSSDGSLFIQNEKNISILDFSLFHNGDYCRRCGLETDSSFGFLTSKGRFLCCISSNKFIAPRSDSMFEYSSASKALSEDFSLLLLVRFAERIMLLIADGNFSSEAYLITLADTPSNEAFGQALIKNLAKARNPLHAAKLFQENEEEDDHEQEI